MLLRRCGWHRMYHGYPLIYGIAGWRGRRVTFTDGICRRCVTRIQAELRDIERRRHPTATLPSAHAA